MKLKILILSLALLAVLPVAAMAQGERRMERPFGTPPDLNEMKQRAAGFMASTTDKRAQLRAEFEARRASTSALFEARKASSTARRVELGQDIAERRADNTAKKLTATIERLEKLAARIESRIAKVEAEGGSAAESKGFVADAKAHLSSARAGLETFSSIELTALKASENFEKVREAAALIKEDLRAAHRSLVEATRSLKPGRAIQNATTTNATSSSQ